MKHTFKSNSGKRTFGRFSEPLDASQYTNNKKSIYTKNSKYTNNFYFTLYSYKNSINEANLNINLIKKLNLQNVPVISDNNNQSPTTINTNVVPYLNYNIDPSGNLFGNTICGVNNYINYMVY
jgi:hypothetical protein